MEIAISEAAKNKVVAKGGNVVIDFIPPVGCGKVSEVSVSTNIAGRTTSSYRKVRQDDVTFLLDPDLYKYISQVGLSLRKGLLGSKIVVNVDAVYDSSCGI